MRGVKTAALLGTTLALIVVCQARAAEVGGSASVIGGTTDADDEETEITQQDYRVTFVQPLTPWITVNLSYLYSRDDIASDSVRVVRELSTPDVTLLYSRPKFTARLNYYERSTTGTVPSDNFDIRSGLAYFAWRPDKGPKYVLQYRDESNVADVALFGRDIDSTVFKFDTIYDRADWNLRFTHEDSELENMASGYRLDQLRDQLKVDYGHRWDDGRYTLSVDTWVSRVDQTQTAPTGSLLAQPVRAFEGLFAVNLSPAIGELNPTPELVDGETDTPVPGIAIGGARIGRNIGVDLGVTQRVSRLEISVDALSDPSVQWDVYHSPDNFNWTQLGGVSSSYDDAFDRYTLLFPETIDRYFKAVNISANASDPVVVTEIRALVDVDAVGRSATESTTYRLNAISNLQPHDLVSGNVFLFLSNEENVATGLVSQETDQLVFGTGWTIDLGHHLAANLAARYSDYEQGVGSLIDREVRQYDADLVWTPLETVRGSFDVSRRDETDDGQGVRSADQVRARLALQIYPTLLLTSEVSRSIVDDRSGGFSQTVVRWTETLESEVTRTVRLGGSGTISWFDSQDLQTVDRRVVLNLFGTWRIFPQLTYSGSLYHSDDDTNKTLNHRHALSWSPGRKASASIYFQDTDAVDTRQVTTSGGSVSYRINRKLMLFANASHSRTKEFGILSSEVDSGRLGLRVTF